MPFSRPLSAIGTFSFMALTLAVGACSDDTGSRPSNMDGLGNGTGNGSGASNGSGAANGSGNAGTGGTLTAADAVVSGTVTQCPGTMPAQLPDTTVSECVQEGCSNAACVPGNLITEFVPNAPLELLATCGDANTYCLPLDFIATTGDFQTKTCTSLGGAEGRCLSACIPQVAERMTQLPVADCAPHERCAPCYDPITGEDTQACRQGCDSGPTAAPYRFAECGNDALGLCVPGELVPPDLQDAVPVAGCTEPGFVCAPKTHAMDINHQFEICEPSSEILQTVPPEPGPNGEMGGCVPAYLVDAVEPAPPEGAVLQDTCPAGFLCAPCTNPLADQAPTGACPLQ